MNSKEIVAQLHEEFPGKTIMELPSENPTEIICEVEPTANHPEYSVAVAVIDRSEQHRHDISEETYEAEKGEVTLFVDGKEQILGEGMSLVVQPRSVHRAVANGARVKVTSRPGWTPQDHILVPKPH